MRIFIAFQRATVRWSGSSRPMGRCIRRRVSPMAWLSLRAAMNCFALFEFRMAERFFMFRREHTPARRLRYAEARRSTERLTTKYLELALANAKLPGAMNTRNESFPFTRQRQLR